MQEIYQLIAAVIIISASGVMAPGPLFAATVSSGAKEGARAGLKIAHGHALVELPLVILIGIGVLTLESLPQFRATVSIIGALSIFAFAALQIRSSLKAEQNTVKSRYGSLLTGVLLTGLNPFFLVWWFTIGIKIISDAYLLWAFWGILIMFGLHIWMDYAWLTLVSSLSAKGARLLSSRRYRALLVGINIVLVYFGVLFVLDYLSAIHNFQI